MPSPAIPRSTSEILISSSSSSKIRLPSSTRSTSSSSRSNKSSYWLAWSNVNKLGNFITIGRKSSELSHSDLTEESLEAHNRRQEAFILQNQRVDYKNAKCSPYYKGLTDYSLVINREKHHLNQSSSPGRESHATTFVSNSSSISSFVLVKIQEWTACFSSLKYSSTKDKQNHVPAPAPAAALASAPAPPVPVPVPEHPVESTPLETDKIVSSVIQEEKPLRERVLPSEPEPPSSSPPPPPPPLPSPPSIKAEATAKFDEKNDTAIDMSDGRK